MNVFRVETTNSTSFGWPERSRRNGPSWNTDGPVYKYQIIIIPNIFAANYCVIQNKQYTTVANDENIFKIYIFCDIRPFPSSRGFGRCRKREHCRTW